MCPARHEHDYLDTATERHLTRFDPPSIFRRALSKKLYCTDYLESGLRIRNVDTAIGQRYIQPNHKNSRLWLVYDIDRPTCVDEITDDLLLPAPHFFVQNPKNQHAHAYYGLATPVHLNQNSSQKAIRFAGAVDCAMTGSLQADGQYAGLIAKNPLHEHWRTHTINAELFTLGDLSEYLDLTQYSDKRKNLPDIGIGRNVNLFERLRRWAYKAIRQGWPDHDQWDRACLDRALAYNKTTNPLPLSEVMAVAKSVAKWTHKNITPDGFSRIQAGRGALNGQRARDAKLQAALDMRSQGHSVRVIADTLGRPKSTVDRWLKRDS